MQRQMFYGLLPGGYGDIKAKPTVEGSKLLALTAAFTQAKLCFHKSKIWPDVERTTRRNKGPVVLFLCHQTRDRIWRRIGRNEEAPER
jgi:hypothetical protein